MGIQLNETLPPPHLGLIPREMYTDTVKKTPGWSGSPAGGLGGESSHWWKEGLTSVN